MHTSVLGHTSAVPSIILRLLHGYGGVASWDELVRRVPPHVVTQAAGAGRIKHVLPRVYADPQTWTTGDTRARAALLFAGDGSALGHTSALAQWPRLHLPTENRIHVLTPRDRNRRSTGFVVIHRFAARSIPTELTVSRRGLPTVIPAKALVDAWSVLPPQRRRAPVIDAVRLGLVEPGELEPHLLSRPKLPGRAELRQLLELLHAGCQSELELMGFIQVFRDRRLPRAERQVSVVVDARRYVLDVAWRELLLAVELDGAAYHGSNEARERDVRRDSDLARAGWLTIRITYERMVRDPADVISELIEIIAARREQLRSAS